jgi:glycosyltransferase involved in cell wall biosynthesis
MPNNNLISGLPVENLVSFKPKKQQLKKVLCWSDSVLSSSGFGTVSKHVLKALYDTGEYEIDQLAINHSATFYDNNEVPYCIVPARLENPEDLFGKQMFVNSLLRKEYDIVLIINDTYVVEEVSQHIPEVRKLKKTHGKKQFDLVYYFPVDHPGEVTHDSAMIDMADRAVAYNKFGADAVESTGRHVTDISPHGVDARAFHPIPQEERKAFRKQTWHADDDTFVLINVNRNTLRKDVAKTILAFSEFKKLVPKSMLYLNMRMIDGSANYMLDLIACIKELNLDHKKDVIFPTKFNPMEGFPINVLNQFYSSADAYITTHLGEGWGLTVVEAMAAGCPVIAPKNTSMPEILGDNRGYLYECKEKIFIDSAGYRPTGRLEDILEQMKLCYDHWKSGSMARKSKIARSRRWAEEHSWDIVTKSWVQLFSELKRHKEDPLASQIAVEVI